MKTQTIKNKRVIGPTPKAQPIETKNTNTSISNLTWIFLSLVAVHALFLLVSSHTSHSEYNFFSRIWGFDNILFYPKPIVFLTYLIVISVCIPSINDKIVQFFSFTFWGQLFNKIKPYKYLLFVLLSVLAIFVFYYFRIKYHFLGDMDIRVQQTVNKEYLYSEYLTMYILHYFHVFLANKFAYTGYQTFVLQSVIAGGLYIFFALLISDLTGQSLIEKVVTFLFFISIGAILFFFGYVEIYSIPALSVVIYVYFALLWVKNKINFILPLITLVLAIAFHLLTVGLAPSFFIVLYQKIGKKIPILSKIKTKPFIIVILLLLPVAFKVAQTFHFGDLMPISDNPKYPDLMVLFSKKHFWEFLNSQILASGLGIFILIYFTFKGIRGKLKFDQVMWFYVTATFFIFYIAFIANKMRGSGDWDICAFPALIFTPMVAYFLFRDAQVTGHFRELKYLVIVIIVMNFVNTLPWVGINSGDKSIKKIATMLESDPGYYYVTKLPALTNLALSYNSNGLKDESLKYYEKIYRKYYNDPNVHLKYAYMLMENGKDKDAANVLNNLIKQAPYISAAYPPLLNIFQKFNLEENIYSTFDFLYTNYQNNPNLYKSNFNSKDLVNYFSYLYQIETQKGNLNKAKSLADHIQQLQTYK
jgi:hypothetical protein